MPLPSALQARLIERGILNASNINAANESEHEEEDEEEEEEEEQREEVFAENYDERDEHHPTILLPKTVDVNYDDIQIELEECIKCPNKWNPYHTCVEYCKKRYGIKHYTPDPTTEKRRRRMIKKYPLPAHWREVPDANLDRCYYWNMETDEVSWLPPAHPRSHITQSATKLRQKEMEQKSAELMKKTGANSGASSNKNKKKKKKNIEDVGERDDTDEEDLTSVEKLKRKIAGKMLSYDADPMDPSSYSDVPRGNWASGLDIRGKAKTGVDETATGELFQMRPYPSPGDILRMNADLSKKKSKN